MLFQSVAVLSETEVTLPEKFEKRSSVNVMSRPVLVSNVLLDTVGIF